VLHISLKDRRAAELRRSQRHKRYWVLVPQAYVFSLGYGLSAAAVGAAVLAASAQPVPTIARLHAGGLAAYGVRLFLFLWRRQVRPHLLLTVGDGRCT
jgi:hypothetical protein